MTDFLTIFLAVFLAEMAKTIIDRYWRPGFEKKLDKVELVVNRVLLEVKK